MNWNSEQPLMDKDFGRTRTVSKFLFLPLSIDGESRWMEWARIEQECCGNGDGELVWEDVAWGKAPQFPILPCTPLKSLAEPRKRMLGSRCPTDLIEGKPLTIETTMPWPETCYGCPIMGDCHDQCQFSCGSNECHEFLKKRTGA